MATGVMSIGAEGIWRHAVHTLPMTYSAGLWSMVFLLGMRTAASMHLGRPGRVPAIELVGQHWFWIGPAVWAMVFDTMVTSFVRALRSR